ncbi:hypothetical protein AX14_000632 [Amanita brunnescens Koide BX004]|nr:hypothetical protein AX14_000632 [Amanita brunnescens Koide BX004]
MLLHRFQSGWPSKQSCVFLSSQSSLSHCLSRPLSLRAPIAGTAGTENSPVTDLSANGSPNVPESSRQSNNDRAQPPGGLAMTLPQRPKNTVGAKQLTTKAQIEEVEKLIEQAREKGLGRYRGEIIKATYDEKEVVITTFRKIYNDNLFEKLVQLGQAQGRLLAWGATEGDTAVNFLVEKVQSTHT